MGCSYDAIYRYAYGSCCYCYDSKYLLWIIAPLLWFIMVQITKNDDKAFRIWWLWIDTKFRNRNKAFGAHQVIVPLIIVKEINMTAVESSKRLASETPVSLFLPYSHHITDTIISTKNAEYLSIWKIDGRSHQSASEEDIFQWTKELNNTLRVLHQLIYHFGHISCAVVFMNILIQHLIKCFAISLMKNIGKVLLVII